MSDAIQFSRQGPPETVLPPLSEPEAAALEQAWATAEGERREAFKAVVRRWPRSMDAWAGLGMAGGDDIDRYAAFRVGYHRGLDALRQNGWRGSGYVRWSAPSNRGFLQCLAGLAEAAGEIGEVDEQERIGHFLVQLEPGWSNIDWRSPS